MRSAILPAIAVLMFASPASWACGGGASRPSEMIMDEARIKPLVEKLLATQAAWEAAASARGRELSSREAKLHDERTRLIDKFRRNLGPDFLKSDDFQAEIKKFDAKRNERIHGEPLPALPAVRVHQIRSLCAATLLDDGHSIDAEAYWIFQRESGGGWDISEIEAHYLIKHSEARPELIEKLERFLGAAAAPAEPIEASRTRSARVQEQLSRLAASLPWN